jgi:hypothetical protein
MQDQWRGDRSTSHSGDGWSELTADSKEDPLHLSTSLLRTMLNRLSDTFEMGSIGTPYELMCIYILRCS